MLYCRAVAVEQRNFVKGVLNGVIFTLAETLIDPTLVLVAFVSHLTTSPILIGLVAPLRDAGWYFPQLWVSGYIQSQPKKLNLYRRVAVIRVIAWAAMAGAAWWFTDANWLLIIFFVTFGTYSFASGFSGIAFMEVVGKTIPAHRRVVFFAWRLFLGGLVGLGGAEIVRLALAPNAPLTFPQNFGLLFAVGGVLAALGLWVYQLIDEPPDTETRPRASFQTQLQRAFAMARQNQTYRRFLLMRMSLILAGAATPFFAVYVQTRLNGELTMVGAYLATLTAASMLANVFFGRYGVRLGNRRILMLAAALGLGMMLVVLALLVWVMFFPITGWAASLWLIPVFVLAGIRQGGLDVAGQPALLEIAPPSERSLYLGFTHSVLGITQLATGLSGVVVASLGFGTLAIMCLFGHAMAFWLAARLRIPKLT